MKAVNLSQKEAEFLMQNIGLQDSIMARFSEGEFTLDEDEADQVRDLCIDKLDTVGFDENYEPTPIGIVLEKLIDLLYVS